MYKEIIKLKYIEDLSINQISEKLNQPVNTIKIKIYRAKKNFESNTGSWNDIFY